MKLLAFSLPEVSMTEKMKCLYLICIILFFPGVIQCSTFSDALTSLSTLLQWVDSVIRQVLDALTLLQQPKFPGPIDCTEIQKAGHSTSGIYRIWPLNWETVGSFSVYCDMTTDGGGWIVIQRRGDFGKPKDYFFKDWNEYVTGFGNLSEDFWLGNERLFALTNQGNYTLRINMKDKEGNKRYAEYQEFWIEKENYNFRLHISGFKGDAGDSLSNLNGMKFTTKDRDNDIWAKNCAEEFKGAWWYSSCHGSNLNGLYLNGNHSSYADGIEWSSWRGQYYSLPEVEMKIKSL